MPLWATPVTMGGPPPVQISPRVGLVRSIGWSSKPSSTPMRRNSPLAPAWWSEVRARMYLRSSGGSANRRRVATNVYLPSGPAFSAGSTYENPGPCPALHCPMVAGPAPSLRLKHGLQPLGSLLR